MNIGKADGKIIIIDNEIELEIEENEPFSIKKEGDYVKLETDKIVYEKLGEYFELYNKVKRKEESCEKVSLYIDSKEIARIIIPTVSLNDNFKKEFSFLIKKDSGCKESGD